MAYTEDFFTFKEIVDGCELNPKDRRKIYDAFLRYERTVTYRLREVDNVKLENYRLRSTVDALNN
jgi:hypothetical protein